MKNLIQTIKNIFAIEDLRFRIFYTLGFVLIYRLGSYVMLPGVNAHALHAKGQAEGLAGLINMFAGGAFARASVFALGIMPYISASIVVQLLSMAFPYFQRMQKEGESGRRKMNQYTRFLTVIITALQAPGYISSQLTSYAGVVADPSRLWWITTVVILVAGTIFVMWLGERITDRGLGNGISIIIMIGILADLPFAFVSEFASRMEAKGGGLIMMLLEIVFLLFIIIGCILLVQGTRKIPVQFAKKIVGNRQYGGVRQYIPLKVNAAGVMPIIFAQAIMFIPITIAGFAASDKLSGVIGTLSNHNGLTYNIIFSVLIILFTYFYTAIMVNPTQMADDMKRNGGFIPGVKPGKQTSSFIDDVMSKITLPGSIFLAMVAIMPAFARTFFGVSDQFARFFGGTSLLIMVGVMLDTLQQIESHLLMRHYDGLMKSGRIKGRTSMSMATA
ncbi:MAG TPA: preprotein translocase subunit SecY [Bacteroidia bacterium]